MDKIQLTQFSKSAGCGCKIAPAVLHGILNNQFSGQSTNVLVGTESFDDAAIVAINDHDCIISTTDFFTPIVNDGYDFGQIAAANAISDVYAMGGKPITAISILGFPVDKIPTEVVRAILSGASKKCSEAGIHITGGHSIDAPEPFFGLSVTGIINSKHIKRNNTANAGDIIYITKPLGTGIFSAALKRNQLTEEDYKTFFENAAQLNKIGEILGGFPGVTAMTDVTGFGLLGHLTEMCAGNKLSASINSNAIPLLPNLKTYTDKFCIPDNTYRNWNAYSNSIEGITPETFLHLNDPQTNGGLLIAIAPESEHEFMALLNANNTLSCAIGNFFFDDRNSIQLR